MDAGIVVPCKGPVGRPYQNGVRVLEETHDIEEPLHAAVADANGTKAADLPGKELRRGLAHLCKALK